MQHLKEGDSDGFPPESARLDPLDRAFLSVDESGRVVYASTAAASLLGCARPLAGLLVRELLPTVPPAPGSPWNGSYGDLVIAVQPIGNGWEMYLRHAPREVRPARLPTLGVAAPPETSRSDRALKESEMRFASIFEQASVGLVETDLDGSFVLVNDRFCEIVGRDRDDLLRSGIRAITFGADLEVSLAHFRQAKVDGCEYSIEKRYVRSDGSLVWVELTASLVRDDEGVPRHILGVVRDITNQKWAEQELLQTQQRLIRQANLLELSHDAIVVRATDGTILFWNRGAEELYGWSREQAEGQNTERLLRTEAPVPHEELRSQIETMGEWQGELVHTTRNGHRIVVESRQVLVQEMDNGAVVLETNHDVTWRKQTEERLRQNEAFLKLVFDAMPACVAYVDTDHRYRFLNDRYREWFGIAPERYVGEPIASFIGQESYAERIELLRKAMGGEMVVFEAPTRLPGGKTITTEIAYSPDISAGKVRGVVIMARDITERRAAEAALRRNEERLRLALANMPITIFNQDRELRYTWIHNPSPGVDTTHRVGMTDRDLYDEATSEQLETLKRHVVERGRGIRTEVLTRSHDRTRFLDLTLEPSRNESGEVDGVMGAAIDITEERRRRERQLLLAELSERIRTARDPNDLLADVTEQVATQLRYDRCMFSEIDPSTGTIQAAHQFAAGLDRVAGRFDPAEFGATVHEMLQTAKEVVVEDVSTDPRTMGLPVYERLGIRSYATIPLHRDGVWCGSFGCQLKTPHRWSEDELALLRAVAERTWFAIESLRLHEELERRVEERTSELVSKNQELEGFTYSVSHDMRTPLRGIVANSRMLMDDFGEALPDAGREHLDRLCAAALKMARLVDDLLQFARLGVREIRKEHTDLTALARDVARIVGEHQGVEDAFDIEPGMWDQCDPKLLGLALHNLFENACKYRVPGRPVHVTFGREETGDHLAYVVQDNGIGFDMGYVDKLFRPFERLHRDDQYPGTGIGLANVKRVVERHGGQVWAEGAPNEGATFRFTLG